MPIKKPLVKHALITAIALIVTLTCGASNNNGTAMQHEHVHQQVEIPDNAPHPNIEINAYPDAQSGYNLHIQLVNYNIQPPELADESQQSDKLTVGGHAHVFINGKKIGRAYGLYQHIPESILKQGVNKITVTLNTHQHDTLTIDGRPITASVTLDRRKKHSVIHRYSSSPIAQVDNE